MAHIFIPDGVRVILFGHGESGQEYLHAFGVQVPDAATPSYADCVAINAVVQGWVVNDYKQMWASGIGADRVVSTGMNSVPAAQASLQLNEVGVRAGLSMPSEVSLYVAATTHLSGRRNRGGQAGWPFTRNDQLTQDRTTNTYKTALEGVFNSLVARMQSAGYVLAVASMVDGAMKPIARYICHDDVIDSRNRRTINRGR